MGLLRLLVGQMRCLQSMFQLRHRWVVAGLPMGVELGEEQVNALFVTPRLHGFHPFHGVVGQCSSHETSSPRKWLIKLTRPSASACFLWS